HGELQGDAARRHAAGTASDARNRRLSRTRHPRPCRQRSARFRHRVLAAACAECHRQLRHDRPARAGEGHHRQPAYRCGAGPRHVRGPERARRSDPVALRAAEGLGRSTGAAGAGASAPNPWLIAILVAFATFMEVLDTTIANVALPYIAGGMGVSEDEASWVV